MSSGLSAGLATFNSCNKAGSIPHFTQHLSRYPNDYQALVWRGRAHSIIGNTAEARADFQKACRLSFGAKKNLAQAHLEHINGNVAQKGAILQNTVRQYPNCSEAWSELGSHTHNSENKTDPALAYLQKASHLATVNNEAKEPWFPWCNQEIGDIYYFEKQQLANARKYYETAVLSGNTLTIGYLGLSRCDILDDNPARAKRYFSTAKSLNPVLVKCETFEKFSAEARAHYNMLKLQSMFLELLTAFDDVDFSSESQTVEERQPSSSQRQHGATSRVTEAYRPASASGVFYPSLPSSSQHRTRAESAFTSRQSPMGAVASQSRQSKGRKGKEKARGYSTVRSGGFGRGDGGNDGSGDGSGSDEEESMSPPEKAIQTWKKLKKEAPSGREYHGMQFLQSKCKNFWYSRIASNVRHAGAFFKKYLDRGNTIELRCSTDENLKDMLGKHESGKYGVIKKSDMNGMF